MSISYDCLTQHRSEIQAALLQLSGEHVPITAAGNEYTIGSGSYGGCMDAPILLSNVPVPFYLWLFMLRVFGGDAFYLSLISIMANAVVIYQVSSIVAARVIRKDDMPESGKPI